MNTSLEQELNKWKHIAAYLGECHAANLHEAELASVSQRRRDRFKSIMRKAAHMMSEPHWLPCGIGFSTDGDTAVKNAVSRLKDHALKIPEKKSKGALK